LKDKKKNKKGKSHTEKRTQETQECAILVHNPQPTCPGYTSLQNLAWWCLSHSKTRLSWERFWTLRFKNY